MTRFLSSPTSPGSRNWGYILLLTFGLMQWFSLSRAFFIEYLGGWVNTVAVAVLILSILVLALAAVWYVRRYGLLLVPAARIWLAVVLFLTVLLTARGFFLGLIAKYVVLDFLAFASLLALVVLGSIPQAFHDLRRVWFQLLVLSIGLNLLAMVDLARFSPQLESGTRITQDALSYRTSNNLDVVLLVAGFAFALSRWQRFAVVVGYCQVIVMQILFQKRLETFYYAVTAGLLLVAWWMESGPSRVQLRRSVREVVLTGALLLFLVGLIFGRLLIPQGEALLSRLMGESRDVEVNESLARYFLAENERFRTVSESLASFDSFDLAFGRGMGGGVEWIGFDPRILDASRQEEMWDALFMPDYGTFGRRYYEVGIAMPILKGGLIFLFAIYAVYGLFFLRTPVLFSTVAGRVCLVIVGAQNIYSLFGGDFNVSVIFQMGNYAACLGFGLSLAGPQVGTRPSFLGRPRGTEPRPVRY